MNFQIVHRSENSVPSRLEFVGPAWNTMLAACEWAPIPKVGDLVEIYHVASCSKAATLFPSGRISTRTEFNND